jgi:hypothetical protein
MQLFTKGHYSKSVKSIIVKIKLDDLYLTIISNQVQELKGFWVFLLHLKNHIILSFEIENYILSSFEIDTLYSPYKI